MSILVQQAEVAELPVPDVQDSTSFASRIRDHWARKQETLPPAQPPHPAYNVMVEPLQATDFDPRAATFSQGKTPERRGVGKKKSQYYDNAFAFRESNTSARERVHRESVVTVEVLTNVIVNDEFTFITDISHDLSSRYQRPESSILVVLTHSACLLLGGSFDPAYTMTVTALPSQVQPITNKRNTMILAKLLEESLGVPPSRGLIKFVGVEEENFACNGKTCAAEIEDLGKGHTDETSMKIHLPRLGQKAATKQQSKRSMRNLKADTVGVRKEMDVKEHLSSNVEHSGRLTPPHSERAESPHAPRSPVPPLDLSKTTSGIQIPPIPSKKTAMDRRAEKVQKIGHRKSFMSGLFGKQSG